MIAYSKILFATDFSEFSDNAANRAAELARAHDADLLLLHVIDYFPENIPNEWIGPEDISPAEYLQNRAKEELSGLAGRFGVEPLMQQVILSSHSARHEIARFAEQNNVDLIVLGTHGRRGLAAILGSTANGVLHGAPCDVLVVRPTS